MFFELRQNLYAHDGTLWVSTGLYPIVRLFDNRRILIDVSNEFDTQRELVIVALYRGLVKNNEQVL